MIPGIKRNKSFKWVAICLMVVLAHVNAEASSMSLKLKSGQEIEGSIAYIDARGVGIYTNSTSVRKISPADLSAESLALYQKLIFDQDGAPKIDVQSNLVIKTQTGTLAYNLNQLKSSPKALVKVTLENDDDLQHNIIFSNNVDSKSGAALATAALGLGGEGMEKEWIPSSSSILAASRMANPHKNVVVYFRAPEKEGVYPYVCTFPGHSAVMKGSLVIGKPQSTGQAGPFSLSSLNYQAFRGSFDKLPDFSKLKVAKEGEVDGNRFNVGKIGYTENFAVIFKGILNLPADGDYAFALDSDDGSRLIIDGKTIINHDNVHGMGNLKRAKAKLTKGSHDIRIEYFEKGGEEALYAHVKAPNGKTLLLGQGRVQNNNRFVGIPLYPPAGEAMIYRNFIQGVGTARGIAVGFSEGQHYAYDAQNARLTMTWKGGFIDAKRHWTGRGQGFTPPSESAINIDKAGAIIADLDDINGAWPATDFVALGRSADYSSPDNKPTGFQFLGYTLNKQRHPIFSWSWHGLRVRDYTRPGKDGGLKRTITIKGKSPEGVNPVLQFGSGDQEKISASINRKVKHLIADEGIRVPVVLKDGEFKVTINYNLK